MRENKFRGKLTCLNQEGDGDWVFGHYCKLLGSHYIIPEYADCEHLDEDVYVVQGLLLVIPETVGMCTGLKDKDGTEIYEGDRVGGYPHGTVTVQWCEEYACFESLDEDGDTSLFANDLKDCNDKWEVIGNIHE